MDKKHIPKPNEGFLMTLAGGRPKSTLCPSHKLRRDRVIQYISQSKEQLLRAYASHKLWRVHKAKFRLIKFLHELDDSSELGPTYPFKWGDILKLYFQQGLDPTLSWGTLEAYRSNWNLLALYLEGSIQYEAL